MSVGPGEQRKQSPLAGVGLGLRTPHYNAILASEPDLPFFEVLVDNYAHGEGPPLHFLERIRARYPIVFHGVGMSLGGVDPLERGYLRLVRELAQRFQASFVSEHLAWTSAAGRHFHELLPLPFNPESIATLVRNILQVQHELGEQILVENSASYLAFGSSCLGEAEFVSAVLQEADCLLLLDLNNLFVNAFNHGFDAADYLRGLPAERVRQMHLAGHDDHGRYLVDAHGSAVAEPVWRLYQLALELFPGIPTSIEWDRDVPSFEVLLQERERAAALERGEPVRPSEVAHGVA